MTPKKAIKIDKMRDYIIVQKCINNIVEMGSDFYCGCCGNILGTSKKILEFPFTAKDFISSLKNKTFVISKIGLYHNTCNHTMFSFNKEYAFIDLDNYIKQIQKPIKQQL